MGSALPTANVHSPPEDHETKHQPMQIPMFPEVENLPNHGEVEPFRPQLLKWVGNKQRFAHEIISYFPKSYGVYFEPFLGSGAVVATLQPSRALASDISLPLMDIFTTLQTNPALLCHWYSERWHRMMNGEKKEVYLRIRAAFNESPNAADLVFISRSCYGGVIRYRRSDGHISTPVGAHKPIAPETFAERVQEWHKRTRFVDFRHIGYSKAMAMAQPGDLVYCDPPYQHSESVLYGAQSFRLDHLLECIKDCKERGVYVVLSIDGTKRSGDYICDLPIPDGLFEREVYVNVGRSMLKRFQMQGKSLEDHAVTDRLMLTY